MQKLFIIVTILFSSISLQGQEYLVMMGKTVLINGKTSFGKFSCTYNTSLEADTVHFFDRNIKQNSALEVLIPVGSFDCGNRMLNRDFGKTLRSGEYPNIEVVLKSFKKENNVYHGDLLLKMLGKELKINDLFFSYKEDKTGEYLFTELYLDLNYFEITPPKKLFGLLTVQDELTVQLHLKMH